MSETDEASCLMDYLGLPVQEALQFRDAAAVAWAVFDPDWYLATYPEVRAAVDDLRPVTIRRFYLERGQPLGHSPNLFFNEAWHLRTYRRVAAAVRDGLVASAFDAYCREGFHGRSPHWLFDEVLYRARASDLDEVALQAAGAINGYDHYLRFGQRENRIGHILFDPAIYAGEAEPFTQYLRRRAVGHAEPRTSDCFDPAWYRATYPAAVDADGPGWALKHYLCNDTPTAFDPLPAFSEAFYLARNSDAAAAVESGKYRNGYAHFLAVGLAQLRAPNDAIDLARYAAQDQVARDLRQGRAANAFVHFIRFGHTLGAPEPPPNLPLISEAQTNALFHDKALTLLPTIGWHRLDFTCDGKPDLSVIMVVHDRFSLLLMTLASLRENFAGRIELILVDAGSSDEVRQIDTYVAGIRLLRFENNIGLASGCNAARPFVSADLVLCLETGAELAPGAVAAAVQRLADDPRTGVVGGKIVRSNGMLREAGIILWRDATTTDYLRDASPWVPEANFVRSVDACSAIFLMLRAALLRQLDGFDPAFGGTRYATIDFCVRSAAAGSQIVYDPGVTVFHPEDRNDEADDTPARLLFQRKHAAWLRFRYIADERVQVFARFAGNSGKRLLFIEDNLPLRLIGSGFVRSNDILRVIVSLGFQVTVFPVLPNRFEVTRAYADIPDQVEVMSNLAIDGLPEFLSRRPGYYDVIWVARAHNLNGVQAVLERTIIGTGRPPVVVLDTEAVAATRDAIRADLFHEPPVDLDPAIMRELANAQLCQSIVVVSRREAAKLTELGFPDVAVIGHMRDLRPTPKAFAQRAGMLFVGAIHQADSPNFDSLGWFVDHVLPLVEQSLGWEARLTVVGFTAPSVNLDRFRNHPRVVLRGTVANTEPVYDQHRLFIAPTRFAAGTPYKVYEAASFGLPVVATQLLADQMEWTDGAELLAADASDPARFAKQVVTLYRDEALWTRIRATALARLQSDNSRERYADAVRTVLGTA